MADVSRVMGDAFSKKLDIEKGTRKLIYHEERSRVLQVMDGSSYKAAVGGSLSNTLVALVEHCEKGLLTLVWELRKMMVKNRLQPNVFTFITLIHGICNGVEVQEISKFFGEMKARNMVPNTVTFNTLTNGYGL
ncbi:hypothetical protein Bca4012_020851 [Brassica carinata]